MTEIATLIEVVKGGRDAVSFLRNLAQSNDGRNEARALQSILDVLREIYFSPGGTRAILEMLAEGNRPPKELTESHLPDFNDYGYRLGRMYRDFDFDNSANEFLGFQARETLHRIRNGKGGVRKRVADLLNEDLTFEGKVDPLEARLLLNEIDELNSEISDAETAIMQLMKETR